MERGKFTGSFVRKLRYYRMFMPTLTSQMPVLEEFRSYVENSGVEFDALSIEQKRQWPLLPLYSVSFSPGPNYFFVFNRKQ